MIFLLILGLFALVMAATSFLKVYRFRQSTQYESTGVGESASALRDLNVRKLKTQAYVYLFIGIVCAGAFLVVRILVSDL